MPFCDARPSCRGQKIHGVKNGTVSDQDVPSAIGRGGSFLRRLPFVKVFQSGTKTDLFRITASLSLRCFEYEAFLEVAKDRFSVSRRFDAEVFTVGWSIHYWWQLSDIAKKYTTIPPKDSSHAIIFRHLLSIRSNIFIPTMEYSSQIRKQVFAKNSSSSRSKSRPSSLNFNA